MKRVSMKVMTLIAVLVLLFVSSAAAEKAGSEKGAPSYKLTDMKLSNSLISGKVVHDPDTEESSRLYIRVTVFFVGGSYAIFSDIVEDGEIATEVHGIVLAIQVDLSGSKKVTESSTVFDSWGEYYR
ncbi:MAG: hypothetical protein IKP22_07845 [Clostridia bacterium]|nr:hypothetical protein [Clostridia bacterium]